MLFRSIGDFFARPAVARVVLHHIEQDAADDGVLILPIAGEDECDVRGMREVGQARAFPDLAVMVLRGESEGVIDAIGVAGHPWDRDRGKDSGVLAGKVAESPRARERMLAGRRLGSERFGARRTVENANYDFIMAL